MGEGKANFFPHSFQHHEKITLILQATECMSAFVPEGTKSSNSTPPNDLCSIYFCCNFFCFCFPLFTDKQLIIFGVNIWDFSPLHLLRLAFIVVLVFSASFGPFIAMVGCFNNYYCKSFPFFLFELSRHAKKAVFDSPGLVDFAIGLVNSVVNSPDGEGSFWGNSDYRRTVINPIHQNFFLSYW